MKYFLFLFTLIFTFFTGCSEKSSSKDSSTYSTDTTYSSSSRVSEAEDVGYGGDISAEVVVEAVPSPIASIAVGEPHPSIPTVPTPPKYPDPYQPAVQSGILTAADVDDNLNLSHFQKYVDRVLQSTKESTLPFMNTKDRVKLTIESADGKGLNHVKVKVGDFIGYTNSQGILYLFPTVDDIPTQTTITLNGKSQAIDLSSKKEFVIAFNKEQTLPNTLDLMFVIDSTGSMGDEMRYLSKEFDAIVANIEAKHPEVDIRFGLTLYKDKGDDYVVKNFPFTSNKNKMQKQLAEESANGGGDYPEAMEEGIEKALNASWQAEHGVRMMFLVADAPPHDDKIKKMIPLIEKARKGGIHIYPIGASGVAQKAEFVMRHLALFTQGRYLWLTDDSGVGNSHAEPKVACYQVTRLDQLIKRVIDSELSGKRIEADKESIIRTVGSYKNGICQ